MYTHKYHFCSQFQSEPGLASCHCDFLLHLFQTCSSFETGVNFSLTSLVVGVQMKSSQVILGYWSYNCMVLYKFDYYDYDYDYNEYFSRTKCHCYLLNKVASSVLWPVVRCKNPATKNTTITSRFSFGNLRFLWLDVDCSAE